MKGNAARFAENAYIQNENRCLEHGISKSFEAQHNLAKMSAQELKSILHESIENIIA